MKKIVEDIRKKGVQRYTVYELDKPFPFCLLNLDNLNISLTYTTYFKYITIELRKLGYNIFFYDERGRLTAYRNIGFTEEKKAIEYFYKLLSYVSQKKKNEKGGCNG